VAQPTDEQGTVTQPFTFDDLREILVKRVGLPADQIPDDPQASFAAMGLDSLAMVEIQLAVQQTYGFTIPDQDAQEIHTPGEAIAYTNRRIQERG
jgi:acyl carrier protein